MALTGLLLKANDPLKIDQLFIKVETVSTFNYLTNQPFNLIN